MLRLVVALPAEARALVERYGLESDPSDRGRLFRNAAAPEDPDSVMLVLTGVGCRAAAEGTARLAAVSGGLSCAWIEVGVAGHARLPAGQVVLAHEVVVAATGETFHPPLVFVPPVPTVSVHTVEGDVTSRAADAAYDRQAAGFVAAARDQATAELVHSLKVISGPPAAALPALAATVEALRPLVREVRGGETAPSWIEEATERWHFTPRDREQLARLVRRWLARAPQAEPPPQALAAARRGRDVNLVLGRWLDDLPVRLTTGAVIH